MQSAKRIFPVLGALMLCACATSSPVTDDARGPFDTVSGLWGGNEFSALSPEGKRQYANQQAAPDAPAPAARAARSEPAPKAPAVQLADAGDKPIVIAANAFAAVFGSATGPVRPSTEQLIRLDSLALVAADAVRADLQEKLLSCRRAGEFCRLAPGAAN